jgi:hypothetical protein
VWPFDFEFFCLRISVVEVIVLRHHGPLKPPSEKRRLLYFRFRYK